MRFWILIAAALYCAGRGILDLSVGNYLWGGVGLLCAAALILIPIPSRAVKYDLPKDDQK